MDNLTTSKSPTQGNTDPLAEPVPDWDEARELWGIAWELHWIGFGLAFSVLAIASLIALVQANKKRGFGRKPFVVAINSLLLIVGVTRALYLLIDPYESKQNGIGIPRWVAQSLFNVAFPCLTSAFSLIFVVFLRVAKLRLMPKKLNARFLVAVLLFHFALVLVTDIAAAIECASVAILLIICQLFFIVWGLILSATFIYSGLKVIYRAKKVEKQLETQRGANTSKVAKVTVGTSCLGLALSALQLYSLVSVYRFYDDFAKPAPWMWWGFQTCARLIEVAMACTIAYSVMKPSERNNASTARRRKPTVEQKILEEKTAMGDII